jgi:hypothetical protein
MNLPKVSAGSGSTGGLAASGFEPIVAAALPFETAGVRRHRKTHAGIHRLDAEMGEQRREIRIVQFVIDDEADIDRKPRSIIVDGDGVAVSAGTEFAIIDRDRIVLRQGLGGGVAGNSRSDYRDSHLAPSVALKATERGSRSFKSAQGALFAQTDGFRPSEQGENLKKTP